MMAALLPAAEVLVGVGVAAIGGPKPAVDVQDEEEAVEAGGPTSAAEVLAVGGVTVTGGPRPAAEVCVLMKKPPRPADKFLLV